MSDRRTIGDLHKAVRALKAARMLPKMKGTLTPEHHEDVRKAYNGHAYRFNISDAEAQKAIGIPGSTFSQWKNGKYNGKAEKNEEITRLVNGWIERDLRKRLAGVETEYVETWLAEAMKGIIETAYEEGCMAAIVAPAGAGKTLVAETMAGEMAGIYVYVDEDDTTVLFMKKLAKAVGVKTDQRGFRTAGAIKQGIIDKLRGSSRIIFIDEAHRLPPQVFGRIRSIHDQAGSPVVFLGTDLIIDRINDRANGHGQTASRCLQWNALEHLINAEDPSGGKALGKPLFTREEIRQYCAQQNVRFDDGGFARAWGVACLPGHGSLRLIGRVVRIIRRINGQDVTITARLIDDMLNMLFGVQGKTIIDAAKRHTKIAATAAA